MPRPTNKIPLTSEEKRLLLLAGMELRARGIDIPELPEILTNTKTPKKFPTDKNGYMIKNEGTFYNPSENQRKFVSSIADYSLFYGSRGSGKSTAGSQKAFKKIMQGESGAVLNPDFENFRYSTWQEFKQWIPWDMVVPAHRRYGLASWEPRQPFTIVFLNGAKVFCKGLRDPESARGPNINWLWYDEAGRDPTGLGWKLACASVRVGKNPQRWATTTPKGKNHWLYDFFIKQDIPEDARQAFEIGRNPDVPFIEAYHGTLEQNKDNLDPGYYASLLATYPSGWLRAQEVLGEFANEGGKVGDRMWFADKFVDEAPLEVDAKLRYWDLAATEKKIGKGANDPDETVGTLMSRKETSKFLEDQIGGQWSWEQIKKMIPAVCFRDGVDVPVYIEQEPGAGGKNQIKELELYLKSIPGLERVKVFAHSPEGDKMMRANRWFSDASVGNMYLVRGMWNAKFLDQVDGFMLMGHDDRVDSVSGAYDNLVPLKKWRKQDFISL